MPQSTLVVAAGTSPTAVQRGPVAALAHRPLVPAGGHGTLDAAAGARRCGAWRTPFADRFVALGEVAGAPDPAA